MHEADPRFPSGRWAGHFHQNGYHSMWMDLTFTKGGVNGYGEDGVGRFRIRGSYCTESGRVTWRKAYDTHDIDYHGWAEIQHGIFGAWQHPRVPVIGKGDGFQIRPIGNEAENSYEERESVDEPILILEGLAECSL